MHAAHNLDLLNDYRKPLLSFVLSLLVLTCLSVHAYISNIHKERNLIILFDLSVFHSDCICLVGLELEQIFQHCKFLVRLKTWYGFFHTVSFDEVCMYSLLHSIAYIRLLHSTIIALLSIWLVLSACILCIQLLALAVSN